MNKQQLAAKIWESANKLRSKIEANEYKDYILGFIFYKFLSDKEEQLLRNDGWEADDMVKLTEGDKSSVDYCRNQLGYFIAYDNLFSTWLKKGKDFDVSMLPMLYRLSTDLSRLNTERSMKKSLIPLTQDYPSWATLQVRERKRSATFYSL